MSMHTRFGYAVLICSMVAMATGCQTPGGGSIAGASEGWSERYSLNPMKWGVDEDTPRTGAPERIVATWVDTILQTEGKPAQRGFGGRVYFYDHKADPLVVEGRLVVYAFDESDRSATDHEPTRRYIFPPEQLTLHQSETEIGQSYSFWLPWDEVGGEQTDVSLIARFEPLNGSGLVVSEQARHRLPGRIVDGPMPPSDVQLAQAPVTASGQGVVKPASFAQSSKQSQAAPVEAKPEKRRLSTTTIQLNR